MRSTRPGEGLSDGDRSAGPEHARPPLPAPLPTPRTPREEAAVIADRLAALVESRRIVGQRSRATVTESRPASERTRPPASGVVGARHSGRLLGNLLLTRGFLVEAELDFVLGRQARTGEPIGRILVDLALITDRDLVELLAEQLRMQVVDPRRLEVDPQLVSRISRSDCRRLGALPLGEADGLIDVAVAEPTDDGAVAELMAILGAPLRLFLATRSDIDAAADRLYA